VLGIISDTSKRGCSPNSKVKNTIGAFWERLIRYLLGTRIYD